MEGAARQVETDGIPMRSRFYPSFWRAAAVMLHFRRELVVASLAALAAAALFGLCLGLAYPVLQLLLGGAASRPSSTAPGAEKVALFLQPFTARLLPDESDPFRRFVTLMAVIAIAGTLGSCCRYLHERRAVYVVSLGVKIWRERIASRLMLAPLATVKGLGAADNLSRLASDTSVLFTGFKAVAGAPVLELLKGVAAAGVALAVDWRIAGVALLVTPLILASMNRANISVRRSSQSARRHWSRLVSALQHSLLGIHVVKLHNAEQEEQRRFAKINNDVFLEERSIGNAKALGSFAVEAIAICCIAALTVIAGWFIFRRGVEPARFVTVVAALMAAAQSLKPLTRLSQELAESDAAAARVIEVSCLPPEHEDDVQSQPKRPPLSRHRREIQIQSVTFCYSGRSRQALRNVNLQVFHGMMVALVGSNGAGKTTLLSMLPRLLNPDTGRVLIDGIDIANVDLRSLRRQIALVPQENALFQTTIAGNIAYGLPDVSRARVVEAARAAYAHDFICSLPRGYETDLGEFGAGLSAGQKQRIAIARAILRSPSILILDEATSQIDSDSQNKIHQVLNRLRGDRTIFITSHRHDPILDADLIVAMDNGEIVDVASPQAATARWK